MRPFRVWSIAVALSCGFTSATWGAPGFELEPCHIPGFEQEVLCGTHTVFEDRAAATGRQLEINFAVIPAVDETAEADPLVVLPGGPGQAGMDMGPLVELVLSSVNESRDIVLVDQRGMGSSHPLECEMPDEDGLMALTTEALHQETKEVLVNCLAALDADVTLYTQDLANQDMHEILIGLGYEQANFYGVSWGTRTAQLYAHQFPEQVRTMVLDGSLPLRNQAPLHAGADGERALRQIFRDCAADAVCQQAFPRLEQDYQEVIDKLGEDGLSITLPDPLTGEPATFLLTSSRFGDALRGILYSADVSRVLPLIIHRANQGDFRALVGVSSTMASSNADSMTIGASLTIFCSEELARMDAADVARQKTSGLIGHGLLENFEVACSVWPKAPIPAIYQQSVTSKAPTLILSGELDPITPPRWGDATAESLPVSLHLIAPATGHNVGPRGCASDLIAQVIEQGNLDGLDGSCLEELTRPSFFADTNGPGRVASDD